jgi:hypothetical protein
MWNPELSITEAKATLLAQNDAILSPASPKASKTPD